MSYNSIINNLVRATSGIAENVSDAELDVHVAKLLAEEAKAKESQWSELGLSGLLGNPMLSGRDSPDPSLPKPNKRFLASVIRTVDGHNAALLKQQTEAAEQAKQNRVPETSKRDLSNRGTSGSAASRLFGGALKDVSRNGSSRRHQRERETERRQDVESSKNVKGKAREREDAEYSRDHDPNRQGRHRSKQGEDIDNYRKQQRENVTTFRQEKEESHRDSGCEFNRDREQGPGSRHRKRARKQNDLDYNSLQHGHLRLCSSEDDHPSSEADKHHGHELGDRREGTDTHHRKSNHSRSRTPTKRRRRSRSLCNSSPSKAATSTVRPRSRSPSRSLSPQHGSKMDKYFQASYDPRWDLPLVPQEGLVTEVGWDNMLAILKERGQKKRRNSPGLLDDDTAPPPGVLPRKHLHSPDTLLRKLEKKQRRASREERRRRRGDSGSEDEKDRVERRKGKRRKEKETVQEKETRTLLDGYEYVKKGGMREWDKGK
ncbi:uncharacterized protein L203_101659 [Cryptococcus depauperatus CBS 7841]|uniref:Uncharacterized protein n=1 Tax=Cryptococcus depauperatus CBS 7841 TaxID=1295531 RepID=A0A1E3IVJ2_9TREE|nr:hypothetical protein L203_00972 [Cryptococcus depauperatus CBS 7841]